MSKGEGFAGQVRNPFTELVVTCRDKAALLSIEVMAYVESVVAAVKVMGEFWGI